MTTDSTHTDDDRIMELVRINEELASEIRDLKLGRHSAPRTAQVPAGRRVAKLHAERNALQADLDSTRAQLQAVEEDRNGLVRHRDALDLEVNRLRGGFRGALRRVRARLLHS